MNFQHSTVAQNIQALRQAFRDATGLRACRIARFLLTLTDNQLRTIFDISAGQVATLRSRLQVRANKATAVEAEAGE